MLKKCEGLRDVEFFAFRPEVQMKEGIFLRGLALTLPVSDKLSFVFRPLENQEMSLIEGSIRNPGPPGLITGENLIGRFNNKMY